MRRLPDQGSATLTSDGASLSSQVHREAASGQTVAVGLVTVSDTRTAATDENGRWLAEQVMKLGHRVSSSQIVPDERDRVAAALDELAAVSQVVIFNGGTGIAHRDTTYDVLAAMLEKTLPGFGELFRMLSWEQVGAAAMLSRTVAGTYRGVVVASLPGSNAAVRLAWEKLLEPELEHLAWEVGR